jgi:hypothetical protein
MTELSMEGSLDIEGDLTTAKRNQESVSFTQMLPDKEDSVPSGSAKGLEEQMHDFIKAYDNEDYRYILITDTSSEHPEMLSLPPFPNTHHDFRVLKSDTMRLPNNAIELYLEIPRNTL